MHSYIIRTAGRTSKLDDCLDRMEGLGKANDPILAAVPRLVNCLLKALGLLNLLATFSLCEESNDFLSLRLLRMDLVRVVFLHSLWKSV